MDHKPSQHNQMPGPARFIGAVFGLVFLGVGVTVIIFLWSAPFGEFGSPPLFFRIMGSLVAVAFVTFGGAFAFAAIKGVSPTQLRPGQLPGQTSKSGKYECPRCAAPLGSDADVSPRGDVKCTHCDSWFNVHAGH